MMERIRDSRAFMGALGMLIVGAILALMVAFYMLPDIFGTGLLTARWWWEIVLNLQILCLAFMWFCHHERILQAEGRWRWRAIGNFLVGVISVSYPIGLLLISAWFDWFRHAPSERSVMIVMFGGIGLWIIGAFVMPIVHWLVLGPEARRDALQPLGAPRHWLKAFWPTFLLLVVLACELARDGRTGYVAVPILMYIQGALPYLRKAGHASPRDADI
ncbi:MAG: hypothetical protein EP335_18870 [Alphaproteobacteria bacterium]|nr:MAG: hypothetical protein EP335_18870 [Alphaproteobacteria bacterium]